MRHVHPCVYSLMCNEIIVSLVALSRKRFETNTENMINVIKIV
jgi:hypothetical protein